MAIDENLYTGNVITVPKAETGKTDNVANNLIKKWLKMRKNRKKSCFLRNYCKTLSN